MTEETLAVMEAEVAEAVGTESIEVEAGFSTDAYTSGSIAAAEAFGAFADAKAAVEDTELAHIRALAAVDNARTAAIAAARTQRDMLEEFIGANGGG